MIGIRTLTKVLNILVRHGYTTELRHVIRETDGRWQKAVKFVTSDTRETLRRLAEQEHEK